MGVPPILYFKYYLYFTERHVEMCTVELELSAAPRI